MKIMILFLAAANLAVWPITIDSIQRSGTSKIVDRVPIAKPAVVEWNI